MNQKHYSQDLNKIVDSHCHLDFKDFDGDRDKIIYNAKMTNVDYLLTISVNLEDFEKVHEVTQNYENIWCTTGIHPNNVNSKAHTISLEDIKNKISEYKYIDFLRGPEEYKYRIGCINQDLITIKIKRKS